MKKTLLFATLSLAAVATQAENVILPDLAVSGISPDGKYLVSTVYGTMVIKNLETGDEWKYEGDGAMTDYTPGLGNTFSNTGILLGSTNVNVDAAYWQNGEWFTLSVLDETKSNLSNGITPDGRVICGSVGIDEFSVQSGTMMIPAIWELGADGKYSEPILLPHPDKDFTGRDPQYITAVSISEDGNTVAGQIIDFSGWFAQPIVYKRSGDEWSYTLPYAKLMNPDGLVFPEFPGDGPTPPSVEDFLTADEKAAYDKAYQEWLDEGSYDYSKYPDMEDFLSEESKAKYEEAQVEYKKAYAEWEVKYAAFDEVFQSVMAVAPRYMMNNVHISHDGKTYVTTEIEEIEDPTSWMGFVQKNRPIVFNIDETSYTKYQDDDCIVSQLTSDGTILAARQSDQIPTAFILKPGASQFETLYNYIKSKDSATGLWMEENMTHDIETYDPETDEVTYVPMMITGIPFASDDLSKIATYTLNFWDMYSDVQTYTYLMTGSFSGIGSVETEASGFDIQMLPDGTVVVSKEAARIDIYTIDGRHVFGIDSPATTTATSLVPGFYIIEATATDGTPATKKVRL